MSTGVRWALFAYIAVFGIVLWLAWVIFQTLRWSLNRGRTAGSGRYPVG